MSLSTGRGTHSENALEWTPYTQELVNIESGPPGSKFSLEGKNEAHEKYANDLTELAKGVKLDPVIRRDDEIRRCIHILSRRIKNNHVIFPEIHLNLWS
ncbi:hypothetical protein L2E82_07174 [Cichorium intybus]|uniref:Uncharacterized protein n=1 Tax=Cichorium intybus TaxID=13427 RepID=A0ACB9G3Y9_CICIN|nr:hypothetical protein L2E82_07174 [Cichorium intybus]